MDSIENILGLARSGKYEVCIWGAGYVGRNYGYELLKGLGINVNYYCDNNVELYGKEIRDGLYCVDKKQIHKDVICFILTSGHLIRDIKIQLAKIGVTKIVNYMELCEYQSKDFFDFQKRKQIVIYTCVVGGYDEVKEPEIIEDNCDYYMISDKKPKKDSIYQYIDINEVINKSITDNARKNRYCKVNAHKIFSQYRYSIYFDGNFVLKGNMSKYIKKLPKTKMALLGKTSYESVYAEAMRCMLHGRDDKDKFLCQAEKYWLEGMPDNFGMFLPGIMIREHNNPICRKVMDEWWQEIDTYTKRDMISLSYVLWKNGFTYEDVYFLLNEADAVDGEEWMMRREHGKKRIDN